MRVRIPVHPLDPPMNDLCKAMSNFQRRHSELIVKYKVSLKVCLRQGISEEVFYVIYISKSKELLESLIFLIN